VKQSNKERTNIQDIHEHTARTHNKLRGQFCKYTYEEFGQVQNIMVPQQADPYLALGLPHSASKAQIKLTYRKLALKYHPDRNTLATPDQQQAATAKFAAISTAYALLSDDARKRDYDHIYKYGGYDPVTPARSPRSATTADSAAAATAKDPFNPFHNTTSNNKRPRGIGYAIHDPFRYVVSGGQRQSTTIAGIHIPPRMNMAGIRFCFSEGNIDKGGNRVQQVSKTTHFVQGKKYTRVETTTLYPDGRKEVVIEDNDFVERRVTSMSPKKKSSRVPQDDEVTHSGEHQDLPWYMSAWRELKDKLTSCHNPCGTIMVQ
jgi:curved DNA-binding protein CbpA